MVFGLFKKTATDKAREYTIPKDCLSVEQQNAIDELEGQFRVEESVLKNIVSNFHSEMDRGLRGEGGNLLMVPSFVTARPNGNEDGYYLALDFGGTNCRICLVNLIGGHKVEIETDKFKFSDEQLKEHGEVLFSTIAEFIGKFIVTHKLKGTLKESEHPLKLGFTFSFPVNQTSLTEGKLVRWTKGFENPGVVGEEVALLLQNALNHHKVPVHVNAIVNDTVGTLVTSAYIHPNTQMGIILGTGTNAAYYEKVSNITKLGDRYSKYEEMAINMEWGAFDNDKKILPLTKYDEEMDQLTWNPNQQIFEKSISGFYLGELYRIIITHLHAQKLVFKSGLPASFNKFGGFDTKYVSEMLLDENSDRRGVKKVLNEFDPTLNLGLDELVILQKVGELVGHRAAQLAASATSAVLLKRPELLGKSIRAGIDGSVFEHFPNFPQWMRLTVNKLMGEHATGVELGSSKDGSGIGAGLISMIATAHAL